MRVPTSKYFPCFLKKQEKVKGRISWFRESETNLQSRRFTINHWYGNKSNYMEINY
jgi:hypothetical protein